MKSTSDKNEKKYPKGHFIGMWMGIGIAIFSGIGIPLSIALNNYAFVGMGPALGVAVGLSIGQGIETKHLKEGRIRPLTDKEKRNQKIVLTTAIIILTIGVLAFTLLYLWK